MTATNEWTMAKYPSVCVVVLNYNDAEDTTRCVESVLRMRYSPFEVVIVDNASPDGSGALLRERFPSCHHIQSPHNDGYAAGNNQGIRYALSRSAEWVFILNNDTIVEPDTLKAMIEAGQESVGAGIVTCRILYERTGAPYASAGRIHPWLCAVTPLPSERRKSVASVNYVAGCAMVVRKDVFETVGLLDERYFMYFEDVEFAMRAHAKFTLLYTPGSTVYHKSGGGDAWHTYSPFYLYYSARNRILVFGHGTFIRTFHASLMNMVNIVAKIVVLAIYAIIHRRKYWWRARVKALVRGHFDGMSGTVGRHPDF